MAPALLRASSLESNLASIFVDLGGTIALGRETIMNEQRLAVQLSIAISLKRIADQLEKRGAQ